MGTTVKYTVELDPDTARQLRVISAKTDKPIKQLLTEYIRKAVANNTKGGID